MSEPIHIISLGAGVQSSAMAIMASLGMIAPMPLCGIFADTGDETDETYQWIGELQKLVSFPVIWLKGPRLSDSLVNKWGHSEIPAWFKNEQGNPSIGRRQCTKYFKIIPVRREIRARYPKRNTILWMGISTDEISRMKPSGRKWLTHRWPLIEQHKSRRDCLAFLKTQTQTEVPKSACVYCPYKDPARWKQSQSRPSEMEIIRRVESVLLPRNEFLTRALSAIEQTDFTPIKKDDGQLEIFENDFNNECEGMCGV